jgi:parallel beta-helix repeat protein
VILGLLLAFSAIVIVNNLDEVAATNRYVGGGGTPNYATITQALAASSSGDIIYVNSALSYTENVNVNVDVTIEATGGMATITPQTENPIFTISTTGVTIKNFNINGQNQAGVDGIYSSTTGGEEGQEVLIENCNIYNCVNGVQFGTPAINTAYHTVTDCNIYDNSNDGVLIYAVNAGNHQIELSSIYNNGNHGIEINGDDNTVFGCNIYTNTNDGIHIFGDTNTVTGDDDGSDDTYIYSNGDDGIDIDGDDNSVIEDCFIHNNTDEGINLYDSHSAYMDECEIVFNGGNGIYMEFCDDYDISDSYFTWNSDDAIKLKYCDNDPEDANVPNIINCDFGEGYTAIHFLTCQFGSTGYEVDSCNFYDRSISIKVEGSSDVDIYSGKIEDCTYGIYAQLDSSNNESTGTITDVDLSGYPTMYASGSSTVFSEYGDMVDGTDYCSTTSGGAIWNDYD